MRTAVRFSRGSWFVLAAIFLAAAASPGRGAETEKLYLSGKGKDDPVPWDFTCSGGRNAKVPSKIGVPSNWELQGFGRYTYGRDKEIGPGVEGVYHRTFMVPAEWGALGGADGKKVYLVFDGVMTDTVATINGESAGPKHQGGFYRFKYDVTKLLRKGQNDIQVTVDDESANASVNKAERRGDYWNFGGIYRPVYLEAVPAQSIERVAIDARADGELSAEIHVDGLPAAGGGGAAWRVEGQLLDSQGKSVGPPIVQPIDGHAAGSVRLSGHYANPRLWTAETPNLYQMEFRLTRGDVVVHSVRQRFGFRTIEVREPGPGVKDPGVFVNGSKVLFKGICRHSFWPDSGRCLSERINRADVELLKGLNINAVRMTHYPPDADFLDACDEAGLYVLDELAGWHWHYDTPTGSRLVEEMVTRDVNHPSILFWDNGNEGGFNPEIDDDFAKWDPQKRAVLHPWATFRGIDTKHYPNWTDLQQHLAGANVYFPTEMLHGMYDGGGGASLQDYWDLMRASPNSAGGFIWAFLDEDVARTDEGGKLDSRHDMAPDGVVGPYREKEGSYYAIKEIWSPLVVTRGADGNFSVENRYNFLDAASCSFSWEYRNFKRPNEEGSGYDVVASGKGQVEGPIAPGKSGRLLLDFPKGDEPGHDCVAVTAKDPDGRELWTWEWMCREPWRDLLNAPGPTRSQAVAASETATTVTLTDSRKGGASVVISKGTGEMLSLRGASHFYNGPRLVIGSGKLTGIEHHADGNDQVVTCSYSGDVKTISYRLRPNGWMTIEYAYDVKGPQPFVGIGFDYYSETGVRGIRYLGEGPYRVWKNRTAGGTMNVWDKAYNNTITGDVDELAPGERLVYPEFKGFYADVRWLQLDTGKGPVTILVHQPDTFVQFFTPQFPPTYMRGKTGVNFPGTDISFLRTIPPIGSKFVPPSITGPEAQDGTVVGPQKGAISFYCGEFPK
ncbi:MAG: glycoside hydrolase family 2 protein [Phycisphaerae bacterium]